MKIDYRPPLYLNFQPDSYWFWLTYGSSHLYVEGIWKKRAQLNRVGEQQNWRCCYCGRRCEIVEIHSHATHIATREHVTPVSHGGGDEDDNIVMACAPCNSERGVSDPFAFIPRCKNPEWSVRVFQEFQMAEAS